MNIEFKDHFTNQWKKYFNNCDLPIIFYYTDSPDDFVKLPSSAGSHCLICELQKVRNGQSVAFSLESLKCGGAKRYLGFAEKIRPNFEYFLSCGIENEVCLHWPISISRNPTAQ